MKSHSNNPCREYWFELYLTKDKYDQNDWKKTFASLSRYIGFLKSYSLIVSIENSIVRYYLVANQDVSFISNNLESVSIRPINSEDVVIPDPEKPERFINYVNGGNVFDIREKYQIKRNISLDLAIFNIRPISQRHVYISADFYFSDSSGVYSLAHKTMLSLPLSLLSVDFSASRKYLREKQPKYLDIQKSLHIMRGEPIGAVFEASTFPYLPKNYYLPLQSYDFDKHSFIIGASGSGKSKLISLIIDRLNSIGNLRDNYRVVVIDPHASIENDLINIADRSVIAFKDNEPSIELFSSNTNSDISAAVELTGTLFKSLLADQFNPKVERVLRFSLFVLMTAQIMSLETLKKLLTDIEYRNQVLEHVEEYVPHNVSGFFKTDFSELRTQSYTEAILPIISFIDEMQLQPSLVEGDLEMRPLNQLIKSHFLTVFSLNKISMGEKVVKTVAGLLMQQIFLLAQSRSFNQKIILIIDEVSIVQNPAMAAMLAEARKYNLSIFLTQQYFGQIDKELQEAIFTNVVNYYTFRVSEEDARALEGNLTIELPKELLLAEKEKGSNEKELRVRMLTGLNVRECLLRLSSNGNILPCIKARTMDSSIDTIAETTQDNEYRQSLPRKFIEKDKLGRRGDYDSAKHHMADIAVKTDVKHQDDIQKDNSPPTSVSLHDLLGRNSMNHNSTDKKEKSNG